MDFNEYYLITIHRIGEPIENLLLKDYRLKRYKQSIVYYSMLKEIKEELKASILGSYNITEVFIAGLGIVEYEKLAESLGRFERNKTIYR